MERLARASAWPQLGALCAGGRIGSLEPPEEPGPKDRGLGAWARHWLLGALAVPGKGGCEEAARGKRQSDPMTSVIHEGCGPRKGLRSTHVHCHLSSSAAF
ncbi:hypothetical protein NDU88_006758 [Pleurodeles waltl]|uniref:Uncharacterized protein n=1 Tax=Pleurodeles waltl TaxID=8319 RepID=A0AAV7UME5_PLEWA|nr:hypothetical protein NDU88_006758 [Pleurodeles waltl]